MDIEAMIKRVDNAYAHLGRIRVSGEELDRLAMARQELRTLFTELTEAQEEERKVAADGNSSS